MRARMIDTKKAVECVADIAEALHPIASRTGVQQVWVFGSSVDTECDHPHDVDIALLVSSQENLEELATGLADFFPDARIHHAGGYPKQDKPIRDNIQPHFVLDTMMPAADTESIRASILSGICVWRRDGQPDRR